MSSREAILNKVRASLRGGPGDDARRAAVKMRLESSPRGVIPQRGQLAEEARLALFMEMAARVAATIERVQDAEEVPAAIAAMLRARNLPAGFRMGDDPRLAAMPWAGQSALTIKRGPSDGDDEVGVSHAFAAVAETGTAVLVSGRDNPTTVNFLPETHIVVIDARDVTGDLETAISRVRERFGKGAMPRTVNLITGPSRSGDIEQKMILGAHGPRALHLVIVG